MFCSCGQHLCKFISSKESIYVKIEFQRIDSGHQHGRCFSDLEHQYGHMMSRENALQSTPDNSKPSRKIEKKFELSGVKLCRK